MTLQEIQAKIQDKYAQIDEIKSYIYYLQLWEIIIRIHEAFTALGEDEMFSLPTVLVAKAESGRDFEEILLPYQDLLREFDKLYAERDIRGVIFPADLYAASNLKK